MGGIPIKTVRAIRQSTSRRLVATGGITTQREIDILDALGGTPWSGWPCIQAGSRRAGNWSIPFLGTIKKFDWTRRRCRISFSGWVHASARSGMTILER